MNRIKCIEYNAYDGIHLSFIKKTERDYLIRMFFVFIKVFNKIDLKANKDNISSKELILSCKTKEGIAFLLKTLGEETKKLTSLSDMTIGPNRLRHIAHLKETKESLQLGIEELKAGKIEIAADFTRAASMSLGRIIGAVDIEDVLDDLFLGFCIGK